MKECALREVWRANRKLPLLPVSPAAKLGSVAHKILELVSRGHIDKDSLQEAWDEAVARVEEQMHEAGEDHLFPLRDSAQRYEVKKRLTFAAVHRITSAHPSEPPSTPVQGGTDVGAEVWLESADGLLGGFVDRIVPGDHGVEILDYKTGAVTEHETGDVKAAYEVQLLLYAGLYQEKTDDWPAKLTLATLGGTQHDVSLDTIRSRELMDEARANLRELNELVSGGASPEQLASPSAAACAFCGYRPACKRYWTERGPDMDWPVDVTGTVRTVTVLGNGTLRVTIDTGDGIASVRGLSTERFGFLVDGVENVVLCNLRPDPAKDSYRQAPMTTGYDPQVTWPQMMHEP